MSVLDLPIPEGRKAELVDLGTTTTTTHAAETITTARTTTKLRINFIFLPESLYCQ